MTAGGGAMGAPYGYFEYEAGVIWSPVFQCRSDEPLLMLRYLRLCCNSLVSSLPVSAHPSPLALTGLQK